MALHPTWPIAAVLRCLLYATIHGSVAHADPAQWKVEGWNKTDFARKKVGWDEILSGGPPKDGIPAIDKPQFKPAATDVTLAAVEPVVALKVGGDARAYPLRILIWHEIVNDVVGTLPVAVTYCPLCNSALAFERRVGDRILDFGTTGKLRNSDLVMYDRQTETWWQQFTGEAIVGELLGTELKLLPASLLSFGDFKARHPDGQVLVPNEPGSRAYGRNPYAGYDSTAQPFLYRGEMPKGIEPMARVVVVRHDRAKPIVVAMEHVRKHGKVTIGRLELAWRAGQTSAVDAEKIVDGRDVGTIEAFFVASPGELRPVPYDVTFAFVAHAFHPDIPIIKE